jgi:hypothetical protein
MTRTDPAGEPGREIAGGRRHDGSTIVSAASDSFEDPQQAPLFNTGRARNHIGTDGALVRDPETSFKSIPNPEHITRLQRVVLSAVGISGRGGQLLTLEDIVRAVRKHFPKVQASSSSIRSRAAECVAKGALIVVDHHGLTSRGNRCRRFRRAD